MSNDENNNKKEPYDFGGIEEFDLQQIEQEVLNDSVYIDVFAGSDPAFKEDVVPFTTEEAASLLNLKTYRYQYSQEKFKDKKFPKRQQIGLMADEVEKSFPECVALDNEGYRYVNYSMLVVPLIETVKQLEKKISILEKKLSEKK